MAKDAPLATTLAGYARWAPTYDATDNPLVAATAWVLGQAPLDVRARDVLELGCGTGRHAAPLLAAGARSYVGVDGSPEMLAVAQARGLGAQARWLVADLHGAWAAPPCDVALIVLVLEHLTMLAPLAAALGAAVRPGGLVRIVELHPERIAAGTMAHFRDGDDVIQFASVAHPADAILAALTAAGFAARAQTWRAEGAIVDAIPKLAKHAGRPLVLDVTAERLAGG